jgi:hypothetical protein
VAMPYSASSFPTLPSKLRAAAPVFWSHHPRRGCLCSIRERPWAAGSYYVRVESSLEDICGNRVIAPFDRPMRPYSDFVDGMANRAIRFSIDLT